jgi:hypothetical protein
MKTRLRGAASRRALFVIVALVVALTVGTVTTSSAEEMWPPCSDSVTQFCIVSFEMDDVDMIGSASWRINAWVLPGDVYSFNWYLEHHYPEQGIWHAPPEGTDAKIEVVINTGDLDPRFTQGYGTAAGDVPFAIWTGGDATTGYTLEAVGAPIEVEWKVDTAGGNCSIGECGDDTTSADVIETAFGGNTQDLALWGEDQNRFTGMWLVTDAQYFSLPIYRAFPEPGWTVEMGNPHLGVDGTTPQVGELIARIGPGMLADVGITPSEAVAVGLETRRVQDGVTVDVPSSVTPGTDRDGNPDGSVILHIEDFPFSVATLDVGGLKQEPQPSMDRLSGADRILTAIAVSQDAFPEDGSAGAVVLARSDQFPDALAGTPLASQTNAPLLLTPPTTLDARTLAEIERVLPPGGTVYLLGGTAALSSDVQAAVDTTHTPLRLAGADRFMTSIEIAKVLAESTGTIFFATGMNFPDALGAGAAASASGSGAVLLTADRVMPEAVWDFVTTTFPIDVGLVAVGGQAAAAAPTAQKAAGADRYETATKLAALVFDDPTAVGFASGADFPDGLTGGAHMGRRGGPLLLVAPTSVPTVVTDYLSGLSALRTAYVYGGTRAVSEPVFAELEALVLG